jgi:hypothetical protein
MANEGGEALHNPYDGRDAQRPGDRDGVEEPTLLGADWPEPSTWGPVLGAGGEELVPIGSAASEGLADEAPRPVDRRRPTAASSPRTGESTPQRPRILTWRVGRGALTAFTLAGGLVGLAIVLVSAVFSVGGGDPPVRDEATAIATVSPLSPTDRQLVEMREDKARLQARLREGARERRAAVEAARRDERRRARTRRAASDDRSTPAPAQVMSTTTTSPARPVTAAPSAPTASPAEREFTPGPWNES